MTKKILCTVGTRPEAIKVAPIIKAIEAAEDAKAQWANLPFEERAAVFLRAADLLAGPLRVTIEHEAPVALGDKLEIIAHVYPAGSTDKFGADLTDRTVTTLTYAVGDETKAVAAIFPR